MMNSETREMRARATMGARSVPSVAWLHAALPRDTVSVTGASGGV